MKSIIFLTILLIFSTTLCASQTITNVNVVDGQLLINGVGFSPKSTAAPLLWENFDDGSAGQRLTTTGKWTSMSNTGGAWFSDTVSYSGNLSGHNRITGSGTPEGKANQFNTNYFSFDGQDEIYYSYQVRYNKANEYDYMRAQIKLFKIATTDNPYTGEGALSHAGNPISSGGSVLYVYRGGDDKTNLGWIDGTRPGLWNRHEVYKKLSNPGVPDGKIWISLNNRVQPRGNLLNYMTRLAGYTFQHTAVTLPLMAASQAELDDIYMYVDDVYVDNTLARVEIGDHPDFWSATNREIQIPVEWSGTEIKATLNMGKFTDIGQLYIYVVDADGNPSPGWPLGTTTVQPPPRLDLIVN